MTKKESSVAPKERINVTFKPATGGSPEEIELPMKLMVIGDFLQRHDEKNLHDRNPIAITKSNFQDVMANQNLTLEMTVQNVLQDGNHDNTLPIQLSFSGMRDFEPASIINQIPETKKLYQIREALVSLKGPMGNIPSFRETLEAVVRDPKQSEIIKNELLLAGIDLSLPQNKTPSGTTDRKDHDTNLDKN